MLKLPFKAHKLALAVALSTVITGCANLDPSHQKAEKTFENYQVLSDQFQFNQDWWQAYHDSELDKLVNLALTNNKNLAKAAIAVNMALYKANLVGAALVPNFSGSLASTAKKSTRTGQNAIPNPAYNPMQPGSSPTIPAMHSGSLNVGYTLDLWQRMADQASAAEWEHSASQQDLQAAKLSLVNAVVGTYFQLGYLQEAIDLTRQSVKDFEHINQIMLNKKAQGIVDAASTNQTESAILQAKNSLNNLLEQQKVAQGMMRNLLNLQPNAPLPFTLPNILKTPVIGVDLDVPVSVIANRPDVRAQLFRLHSAFKDAKAMQKSWFPSITLGASLASAGSTVGTALHAPVATGLATINLPFLSWNTVRWNVKLSEAAYNLSKLNFEQSITTALNDIDKSYFSYEQAKKTLVNQQGIYDSSAYMANYYRNRYNVGVTELRDWLSAKNAENANKIGLLGAKIALLQSENAVYSAMGGLYKAPQKLHKLPLSTPAK